ncbi:MAG: hypothetical protein ACOYL1_04445 [Chlamydiia bacterium]
MKFFITNLKLFFWILCVTSEGNAVSKTKKGLVLLFCSEDTHRDRIHKKIWQKSLEEHKEDFEIYYVHRKCDLTAIYAIEEESLFLKRPKEALWQTSWGWIESLHILQNRLEAFDYVIQADIRSFLVMPKLKNILEKYDDPTLYLGNVLHYENGRCNGDFVDHSFCLLGKQSAKFLANSPSFVEALRTNKYLDEEILVGAILRKKGITPVHIPSFPLNRFVRPYKIRDRVESATFVFPVDLKQSTKSYYYKEQILLEELFEIFT